MPGVELAPELLDQALLVLGQLRVALGEDDLTPARHQAQELHRPDYARGRPGSRPRDAAQRAMPSASTGPGAGADVAQPVANRLGGDPLGRHAPPRAASSPSAR